MLTGTSKREVKAAGHVVKVLLGGDVRAPLESDVFKYGSVSDDEVRVRMNPTRDVTAERLCVSVFIRYGKRVEAAASIRFSCDETTRKRVSTRWEDMDAEIDEVGSCCNIRMGCHS